MEAPVPGSSPAQLRWGGKAIPLIAALGVFLADRATKAAVERFFAAWRIAHPAEPPSVPVLGEALRLTYAPNAGTIFGWLHHSRLPYRGPLLTLATVAALAVLVVYFRRLPGDRRLLVWGTALVLGGACGNLLDRLLHGHVIDFIDVSLGWMRWYVFNVADAAITCGIGLMAVDTFRTHET